MATARACVEPSRFLVRPSPHLKCPICLSIARDAVRCLRCDQVFGKACWEEAVACCSACPLCRASPPTSARARLCDQLVSDMQVVCAHAPLGCSDTMTVGDMDAHAAVCPYATVRCDRCQRPVVQRERAAHRICCDGEWVACPCGNELHAWVPKRMAEHGGCPMVVMAEEPTTGTATLSLMGCGCDGPTCGTCPEAATWCRKRLETALAAAQQQGQAQGRHLQLLQARLTEMLRADRAWSAQWDLLNATLQEQSAQIRQQRVVMAGVEQTRDHAMALLAQSEAMRASLTSALATKEQEVERLLAAAQRKDVELLRLQYQARLAELSASLAAVEGTLSQRSGPAASRGQPGGPSQEPSSPTASPSLPDPA